MIVKTKRDPDELDAERERIRDVSEAVYRLRLNQDHPENVDRMLAKDAKEGEEIPGQKLRNRAGAYDKLTRCYLKVLA